MPKRNIDSLPEIINIALVDDSPLAIEGWKILLEAEPDIHLVATLLPIEINHTVDFEKTPNIILAGVSFYRKKLGRTWIQQLREKYHEIKVLVIADSSKEIQEAKKIGADEAILTPVHKQDLLNLIHGAIRDPKRRCDYYAKQLMRLPWESAYRTEYENLIYGILRFLFWPNLNNPRLVNRFEKGNGKDLIFTITSGHTFWDDVMSRHKANYLRFSIINNAVIKPVDFNNLKGQISGPFGSIGIIVARRNPRKGHQLLQYSIYSNDSLALLMISDLEIRTMLSYKAAGVDPIEFFRGYYEDFLFDANKFRLY